MSWTVAYTNPRCEFRSKWGIEQLGFECYLPIYRAQVRHARRTKTVERPAFVRYVFINNPGNSYGAILTVDGIECLLSNDGKPMTIQDGIINKIKQLESIGFFDERTCATSARFRKGETVRIADGPFSGIQGKFVNSIRDHVVLMLEFLGASRPTSIPLEFVEKV